MSNVLFAQQWTNVREDLSRLLRLDQSVQNGKPIENRHEAMRKVTELYYRSMFFLCISKLKKVTKRTPLE